MKNAKGIYCLEVGEWFGSLKKKYSVEPILELLKASLLEVPYIHRDIATKGELIYYLRKWTQAKYNDYPILYLAFHGVPGGIELAKQSGRKGYLSTGDLFAELQGKCHKRIIHFGACSVLKIHGHTVNRYLRDSGALAISGYTLDVDWVTSSVFDLLFLAELQSNQMTRSGVVAVLRRIKRIPSTLNRNLSFKMVIKP